MNLQYTGIGSRAAPPDVLDIAKQLGRHLGLAGWTLRSGAAEGCDTAFEAGALEAGSPLELYLPWKGYNGSTSDRHNIPLAALRMAKDIHPAWESLSQGVQKMHACSCLQVLGQALDTPSAFTLCWTKDGCESEKTRTRNTGGTASGIVLAERNGVPLFNLGNEASRPRLNEFLRKIGIDYQVPTAAELPDQGSLF